MIMVETLDHFLKNLSALRVFPLPDSEYFLAFGQTLMFTNFS